MATLNAPDAPLASSPTLPVDFEGWWNLPEHWVEEPNQRRCGWSGMFRLEIGGQIYYIKKQCQHLYRSLRHPFGWPTALREYRNIKRLNALGVLTPKPVFHGVRHSEKGLEGLLVTEELTGFGDLHSQKGLPAEKRRLLAQATGRILARMHRAHLQHSCLYDKHIMVCWNDGQPEVALIDLEKLRRPALPWRAAAHDLEQLRRRQTLWTQADWAELEKAHRESRRERR